MPDPIPDSGFGTGSDFGTEVDSDPDPDAVGRALTALAHPDDVSERRSYERTIADARAAFSDVATAAAFLDGGGEVALRRAVGAATRADDHSARAGRALLRDLGRLRAAIEREGSSGP